MKHLWMFVLLLAPPADAGWKASACKEACIPAHDTKVIGCKTVDTREKKACLKRAEDARKKCEADCDAKYKETPVKKPAKAPTKGPGKV